MIEKIYRVDGQTDFSNFFKAWDYERKLYRRKVRTFDVHGNEVYNLTDAYSFVVFDHEAFDFVKQGIEEGYKTDLNKYVLEIKEPTWITPSENIFIHSGYSVYPNNQVWAPECYANEMITSYPPNCDLRRVLE